MGEEFDNGDFGTVGAVKVGELAADGPAADDDDRRRGLTQLECLAAGEDAFAVGCDAGQGARDGAGGDEDVACLYGVTLGRDAKAVRACEACGAVDDVDLVLLQEGFDSTNEALDDAAGAVDGDRILTSREALELRHTPASIVIVGGGPIGCEFAYLYRSYGAEVTLVELLPHLLPNEDEDVSKQLERSFSTQGIAVRTGASVAGISVGANGVSVRVQSGETAEDLRAERVLMGVGFGANTDALGLREAGVETDEQGWVRIDDYARTNVPSVWAAGDVTGRMLLAHVASHQGVAAVETMAGHNPPPLDYDHMPRAVYCQPQVASLGLSEAQARERGIDVRIGRFPFRASGKAMAMGDTEGFVKLVVNNATNAIAGWHIIGHNATELLGEATLATTLEATTAELSYAVHAHPTLAEAIKEAAQAAGGQAIHFFTRRGA